MKKKLLKEGNGVWQEEEKRKSEGETKCIEQRDVDDIIDGNSGSL